MQRNRLQREIRLTELPSPLAGMGWGGPSVRAPCLLVAHYVCAYRKGRATDPGYRDRMETSGAGLDRRQVGHVLAYRDASAEQDGVSRTGQVGNVIDVQ